MFLYSTVSTLKPIVGIVVTTSPNLSLYRMVVLPAASRPTCVISSSVSGALSRRRRGRADHENTHLLLAEHALPDAGEGETHLCRVWPFLSASIGTALHLRKGFLVRESRFRRFSLSASSWCVRWPGRATPTRWVRPGSRRWQPFRDLQGRTVQPRHRFGAHRHRLQLSIPMRRTRASGSSGLRMPRGGDLAQKNREAVAPSAAKARCRARSLAVP